MKSGIFIQLLCLLMVAVTALASGQTSTAVDCSPGAIQMPYSSGICSSPQDNLFPVRYEGGMSPAPSQLNADDGGKRQLQKTPIQAGLLEAPTTKTIIYFFWGRGCPHCEKEKQFLDTLQGKNEVVK